MTTYNLYSRIVFKVSGESLGGGGRPQHPRRFEEVATSIADVHRMGVDVIVVMGGGNLWRGPQASDWQLDPTQADVIGMYATGMNVTPLAYLLGNLGLDAQIFSRGPCAGMGIPLDSADSLCEALDKRTIALVAGGMGVTGISTDVAAVSAAVDAHADAVIMSKFGVDGVYDCDPRKYPAAVFLPELTASEALMRNLAVMDATALTMARDCGKPIHVIPASEVSGVRYVIEGKEIGSRISPS